MLFFDLGHDRCIFWFGPGVLRRLVEFGAGVCDAGGRLPEFVGVGPRKPTDVLVMVAGRRKVGRRHP